MLSGASRVAGLVALLLIPQNIDTARQDGCCLFGLPMGLFFCYKLRFIFLAVRQDFKMSRVCQITGKRSLSGNNVSHANNRNKRLFKPNLHARKIWVESENRWVRLRISCKGLRIIDKNGIDAVLKDVRSRGIKV